MKTVLFSLLAIGTFALTSCKENKEHKNTMPPQGVISLLVKDSSNFIAYFFSTATQLDIRILKYSFFSIAEFGINENSDSYF